MSKGVEIPQSAIEAVAKAEFDRLERGDLRIRGGPKPWTKCEPHLREEMLEWATDTLQAALPAISSSLRTTYRAELEEELLGENAIRAFRDAALPQSAQLKVPAHQLNEEIRAGIRAALSIAGKGD